MSDVRVRRSGLVTFGIRLASTITGLAFIVIVTSNLSQADYGLWQLISRTIGYILFLPNILYYWTIRYRARNITLGRTVVVSALIFSALLTPFYLLVSVYVSRLVVTTGSFAYNLHYFLLSSPQVPLYIVITILECILWGSKPARASFGFGVFEIAKVFFGFVSVGIFHLSLTGAILAVIGAQIIQLGAGIGFTRREFTDRLSLSLLSTMVRNGWLALLNSAQPFLINFDFLIVGAITRSTNPLAVYGAAYTFATVITYTGWIALSLYASLLGGRDPLHSTRQVLELQYLFLFPMTTGEIILAPNLMHLLNPIYTSGYPILVILAVSSALISISTTFDNVLSGTDTTDSDGNAKFSAYLSSKMFFISRINIGLTLAYIVAVAIAAIIVVGGPSTFFGFSQTIFLGICWSTASLGMSALSVIFKLKSVRSVSRLSLPWRTWGAYILSSLAFLLTLSVLLRFFAPTGGEVSQALHLLGLGLASLLIYFGVVAVLSDSLRNLAKVALTSLMKWS